MAAGGIRAVAEGYKPCAAMVATQCIFAGMTLWVKAAFGRSMSPTVFVVYRQAVATLVLAPIAVMANRTKLKEISLGMRGFFLVFVTALFGYVQNLASFCAKYCYILDSPFGVVAPKILQTLLLLLRIVRATANQNLCYEGLHLGTSSLATTMTNLIPAITFVMAAAVGQERVNIREVATISKNFGTAVCVGGAITLVFFKGPKLLNNSFNDSSMVLHSLSSKWVMGAVFLVGSSSCWSLWLIMQAPICKSYMDPLTLSAWTCFLSTLQSAAVAFLLPDLSGWKIHSL